MSEEQAQSQPAPDPLAEVSAMQKLAEAVRGLQPDAIGRVLQWALGFYGVVAPSPKAQTVKAGAAVGAADAGNGNAVNGNSLPQFAELAELYSAVSPEGEADKALVVGYWFQFGEGRTEFSSQDVNSALKNLGHPVKNITSAFDTLKTRKPGLVMQLKKSGTSRQARKTFKLTIAGKSAVESMIGQYR